MKNDIVTLIMSMYHFSEDYDQMWDNSKFWPDVKEDETKKREEEEEDSGGLEGEYCICNILFIYINLLMYR